MKKVFTARCLDELSGVAKKISKLIPKPAIIAFYGKMGSGKTTLIKALCSELNVNDNITSPTFSIVNEYFSNKHGSVYHFDFYRIKNEEEAMDIGAEELFYSGNYCFIEWPEKINNLLPSTFVRINIVAKKETRIFTITDDYI